MTHPFALSFLISFAFFFSRFQKSECFGILQRCPPTFVSDIFSDLRDGSQLLNLLEVMSGQPMVSFTPRRRLLTEFRWKCGFCNGAVVARSIAVEKAEGSRRLSAEGQHRDGTELPQEKVCKSAQKTTKEQKTRNLCLHFV